MPDEPVKPKRPAAAKPKAKPAPKPKAAPKAKPTDSFRSSRWSNAGLGAAIGSAAIVAALLYVNRGGKKKDGGA